MKTCCYLCKTREKYLVLSKFYLFRRSILIFVVVIVILQFLLEYNYWCHVSFFLFVSSVHYFMLYFILFKLNLTFQTFVKVNPSLFKGNLKTTWDSRWDVATDFIRGMGRSFDGNNECLSLPHFRNISKFTGSWLSVLGHQCNKFGRTAVFSLNFSSAGKGPFIASKAKNMHLWWVEG